MIPLSQYFSFIILLFSVITFNAQASFSWSSDFRLRLETDWDSQKANGSKREDRTRARIRLRGNGRYQLDEHFYFSARARIGSNRSQQSPHYTIVDFDGNSRGDFDLGLDKWFVGYKNKTEQSQISSWLGRNGLNLWKQNELFWDDDATVAGIGLSTLHSLSSTQKIGLNTGFFTLPVGLTQYSGELFLAQVHYQQQFSHSQFTIASGLIDMNADVNDRDGQRLLLNNGALDYRIWLNSLQVKLADWPITFGLDVMTNILGYNAQEYALAKDDEKNGFVFSAGVSRLFNQEKWSFKYTYANIGALSVNSSYAQDDWLRWGNAVETRATDFYGHEFRLNYQLSKKSNLIARLYTVNAKSTVEDGNRFRVDWNIKF